MTREVRRRHAGARSAMPVRLAAVLGLVGLVGLAWWWFGSERPPAPGSLTDAEQAAATALPDAPTLPAGPGRVLPVGDTSVADGGDVRPLVRDMPPAASDPASPRAAAAYPTGSLIVRLTWEEDGTPAAGVHVALSSCDADVPPDARLHGEADAEGTWVCEAAPAGATLLRHDRGDAARVRVAEGGETVLEVAIPPGIDLTGRVVAPPDTPAPDATVWLVVGNGLRVPAARTDAAGRFALRDVGRFVEVSATAPGHAPSMRVVLDRQEPTAPLEIELPLGGPCGDLEVRVRDPGDEAVEGARVRLDVPTHRVRPLSSWRESEREGHSGATDAGGRFVLIDVAKGSTSVKVVAEGYATWRGSARVVAGGTAVVDVELVPEAVVRGTVRDAAGRPVPGASLSAWGGSVPVPFAGATSADDGSYVVRGVPSDATSLRAWLGQRDPVEVTRPVQVAPGDELPWDPVLDLGRRVDGRVVTADGRPAGRHALAFRDVEPPEPWSVDVDTDALGRFTLGACPGGTFMVEVYDWTAGEGALPLAVVHGVRASGGEIVLTIPADVEPTAYVTARLAASEDAPEGDVRLSLTSAAQHDARARGAPVRRDEETGADTFGPLVPGDYELFLVQTRGMGGLRGRLPVPDLRAGETRDLGTVTPPARGRVVVRLARDGEGVAPRLSLVTAGDGAGGLSPYVEWEGGGDTWTALAAAGRYRLSAFAPDVAPRLRDVTVEPGRDTEVVIDTGPIVRTDLTFELPVEGPDPPHLAWAVRDARGETVVEGGTNGTVPEWKAGGKPMTSGYGEPSFPPGEDRAGRPRRRVLAWFFAPGTYTVSARFEGGPAVEKVFDVPDDPAATARVDLPLR